MEKMDTASNQSAHNRQRGAEQSVDKVKEMYYTTNLP